MVALLPTSVRGKGPTNTSKMIKSKNIRGALLYQTSPSGPALDSTQRPTRCSQNATRAGSEGSASPLLLLLLPSPCNLLDRGSIQLSWLIAINRPYVCEIVRSPLNPSVLLVIATSHGSKCHLWSVSQNDCFMFVVNVSSSYLLGLERKADGVKPGGLIISVWVF